jgi:hypothetical protein
MALLENIRLGRKFSKSDKNALAYLSNKSKYYSIWRFNDNHFFMSLVVLSVRICDPHLWKRFHRQTRQSVCLY